MNQSSLFSSGLQLAPFLISSGLLSLSWNALTSSEQFINSRKRVTLSYKVQSVSFHEKNLKIIAFETQDHDVQLDLVSSSVLQETNFKHFDFLLTERNPDFSFNKSAISLFQNNYRILAKLKEEFAKDRRGKGHVQTFSSNPLIVTGSGLAGSVAYLFTLFLLDIAGSGKNRPLCITFGAPLIGDKKLQQAISRSSIWNSCFLNVVSHKDPLLRLFTTNQTTTYTPFGTFLLCSDAGSTSSENPDLILELLVALNSTHFQTQGFRYNEYGNIVKSIYCKVICKNLTARAENINLSDSLLAIISLQLLALGLTPSIQGTNSLKRMKKLEGKFIIEGRTIFDPSRKLNVLKKDMAQLEWYKKKCKNQGIGYYDSFRNMYSQWDHGVIGFRLNLTKYWKNMVEEAELKPQTEVSQFRTRWLYAGTTYRRMVEPLVIADYYRDKGQDYVNNKRSAHFKKLEEWLEEGNPSTRARLNSTTKHNVESILTLDSCFWAHVEEALIACKEFRELKKEEAKNKLHEFEKYVYESLKKYTLSPEILLPESSYIRWWKEYKDIKGSSYDSNLAIFMGEAGNYDQYAKGTYGFP